MKRNFAALLSVAFFFSSMFSLTVSASEGEANMDSGGGELLSGSSSNFWNIGDEGVRVSVIKVETGEKLSKSIDISNVIPTDIKYHFGNYNKLEYKNGRQLSVDTTKYVCSTAITPIPTIISDGGNTNIEAIKSYFCSEYTLKIIADDVGLAYSTMINCSYKIMIEPIAYFTFKGNKFAMTATEAALYDQQLSHGLYNKMWPLTHMNLPLSIFLETSDLGFPAWTGADDERASNADIISSLGIGVVRFTEQPEALVVAEDCEYRTDTDVVS